LKRLKKNKEEKRYVERIANIGEKTYE